MPRLELRVELAGERGVAIDEPERDALGRSLPGWPVFGEVRDALSELRERGWKLAILSNSDRDLIEASIESIGVEFELAVVAGEIGSYKPAHKHFEEFFARTGADRAAHVHVAQSHFHDVVPANELGLRSIWINRLGETGEPPPSAELRDLNGVADAAEELVHNVDRLDALREDAAGRPSVVFREGQEVVEETRRRFDLNVSEELALEQLAYRVARACAS